MAIVQVNGRHTISNIVGIFVQRHAGGRHRIVIERAETLAALMNAKSDPK
jgi:hypothetical protein